MYNKNNSIKNVSFHSTKTDGYSSIVNKEKLEKKSTISNSFKTTTLSNYNEDDDNSDNIDKQSFNKKRTTLKEEIEIRKQYEKTVPNYYVRKGYDLMRIVEDQVN